jgi:hypothetical protein
MVTGHGETRLTDEERFTWSVEQNDGAQRRLMSFRESMFIWELPNRTTGQERRAFRPWIRSVSTLWHDNWPSDKPHSDV